MRKCIKFVLPLFMAALPLISSAQTVVKTVKFGNVTFVGDYDKKAKQPSGKGSIQLDAKHSFEANFDGTNFTNLNYKSSIGYSSSDDYVHDVLGEKIIISDEVESFEIKNGSGYYTVEEGKFRSINVTGGTILVKYKEVKGITKTEKEFQITENCNLKITTRGISTADNAFEVTYQIHENDKINAHIGFEGDFYKDRVRYKIVDFDPFLNNNGEKIFLSHDCKHVEKVICPDGTERKLYNPNMPDFLEVFNPTANNMTLYSRPKEEILADIKKYVKNYDGLTISGTKEEGYTVKFPSGQLYYFKWDGNQTEIYYKRQFPDGEVMATFPPARRINPRCYKFYINKDNGSVWSTSFLKSPYNEVSEFWEGDCPSLMEYIKKYYKNVTFFDDKTRNVAGSIEDGIFYEAGQSPSEKKKAEEERESEKRREEYAKNSNAQKQSAYNAMIAKVGNANYNKLMNNQMPTGITIDQLDAYASYVNKYYEETEHAIRFKQISNTIWDITLVRNNNAVKYEDRVCYFNYYRIYLVNKRVSRFTVLRK